MLDNDNEKKKDGAVSRGKEYLMSGTKRKWSII